MALRTCAACLHPERNALDEALERGEPYRALTRSFGVSIGSMKRHRKAHLREAAGDGDEAPTGVANQAGEPDERVYLRFGALPEGGRSSNAHSGDYEDGLSVFAARRVPGGYRIDIPPEQLYEGQIASFLNMMMAARACYIATGTEVGEGSDGEPILEDATLKPLSRMARVELPLWLGEAGKKFGERWNKRRRNAGRDYSWGLEEEAAQVLVEMACHLYDTDSPEERSAGLVEARRALRKVRYRWGR